MGLLGDSGGGRRNSTSNPALMTMAPSQNDNRTEFDEYFNLPYGFTPKVYGYLELTVFDVEVHVLVVERVSPLRRMCQSWHSHDLSPVAAEEATRAET